VHQVLGLSEVLFCPSLARDDVVSSYGVVTTGKYGFTSAAVDALTIAPGAKGFVSNFAFEISKHRCWDRELDGLVSKVAF
jgi:catalase